MHMPVQLKKKKKHRGVLIDLWTIVIYVKALVQSCHGNVYELGK